MRILQASICILRGGARRAKRYVWEQVERQVEMQVEMHVKMSVERQVDMW